LAFTVNAALGSISRASSVGGKQAAHCHTPHTSEREVVKQQHQLRALASQNHRLMDELTAAKKEMSRLQMELQLLQSPQQLRRVQSEKSASEMPRE
jgi:predicted RNase H-like nuclease (RuvC/YqgF family)